MNGDPKARLESKENVVTKDQWVYKDCLELMASLEHLDCQGTKGIEVNADCRDHLERF